MTKQQQTAAIIGGVIVALILVMLWRRRASSTVVQQGGAVNVGGFSMPGFNMGPRTPILIPPMGTSDASFAMLSACCADCSHDTGARTSYLPARGPTYVFNAGNQGPNIYVYQPPPPPPKPRAVASFSG